MILGFPPGYWPYLYWPLLPEGRRVQSPRAGVCGVSRARAAAAGYQGAARPSPAGAGHMSARSF